jgi:hypothetical protein
VKTVIFAADLQEPVTYTATIESATSMKGTIHIAGLTGLTFSGKEK